MPYMYNPKNPKPPPLELKAFACCRANPNKPQLSSQAWTWPCS